MNNNMVKKKYNHGLESIIVDEKSITFLDYMFKGYMTLVSMMNIPMDRKYRESVEDIRELISMMYIIRNTKDDGKIEIVIK